MEKNAANSFVSIRTFIFMDVRHIGMEKIRFTITIDSVLIRINPALRCEIRGIQSPSFFTELIGRSPPQESSPKLPRSERGPLVENTPGRARDHR